MQSFDCCTGGYEDMLSGGMVHSPQSMVHGSAALLVSEGTPTRVGVTRIRRAREAWRGYEVEFGRGC